MKKTTTVRQRKQTNAKAKNTTENNARKTNKKATRCNALTFSKINLFPCLELEGRAAELIVSAPSVSLFFLLNLHAYCLKFSSKA